MEQFKIRASASGNIKVSSLTDNQLNNIITLEGKNKVTERQQITLDELRVKRDNPVLTEGSKTFIQTWLKEQIYERSKNIENKYMSKGLEMEDQAIQFISSNLYGGNMMFKNEELYSNNFFTGTPDVIYSDTVIDVKCSWDAFTFPLYETEIDAGYYAQLQVYMDLLGLEKADLVYCLMDTPKDLIYNDTLEYHTYGSVDPKYRIKRYSFEKDEKFIQELKNAVIKSREYINTLTK